MNINTINMFLFIVILILATYALYNHLNACDKEDLINSKSYLLNTKEHFTDSMNDSDTLLNSGSNNLKNLNDTNNVWGQFCSKLDVLSSDNIMYRDLTQNKMYYTLLEKKKKKTEQLIETLFKLIDQVYNNKDDTKRQLDYRKGYNNEIKKKLEVINIAYNNVKNMLNNQFKITVA